MSRSTVRSSAPGARLGPGSMLWKLAGDWRSGLAGLSAGTMQLMWPDLGRGVQEHSAFFSEPWERINRSIPQIWGTILDHDAASTEGADPPAGPSGTGPSGAGRGIRDLHKDIGGRRGDGSRYHALDPDTFWWAHATFTWEMFQTIDRFDHGALRGRRRERLYQETVTWYRRYGVSDRPVPPDVGAFERRFDEICRHELELTPTADRAISMALEASPPADGADGVTEAVAEVMVPVMRTLTIGCLPPVLRRRFDLPWRVQDEAMLAAITLAVRNLGLAVPPRLLRQRYLDRIQRMGELAAPHPGRVPVPS